MKSLFKKAVTAILTWEAKSVLNKYKPTIIAITGSVGKTSTKDAIFSMIKSGTYVRKTDKNLNSEIGLPLTVLGLQNAWTNPVKWLGNIYHGAKIVFLKTDYPKCLVLEVGADHPGDIKNLVKWLHPDVAVITAVSKVPVHVEFFKSPEAVLEEKLALVRGIKSTGKIVLPANNPDILAVREAGAGPAKGHPAVTAPCLTFAVNGPADVSATETKIVYENMQDSQIGKPTGMSFILNYSDNHVPVSIKDVVGIQHIYTITAAAAAAISYGTDFKTIVEAVNAYNAPKGRMNLIAGINSSVLIDDTYNSSPDATKEALAVLKSIETTGKKIAILSDMMELGKFSSEQHKNIGQLVAEGSGQHGGIDMLITVGIRSKYVAEGARAHGMRADMIQSYDTALEAAEYAPRVVGPNDVVLIKGSQSGRMERVVKVLLADPSRASELIVRQEPEWLARK